MRPTRVPVLLAIAVVGGLVAGLGLRAAYDALPQLPASWPVTVGVAAVLVAFLASSTRNRLAGRMGARRPPALLVARYAALARACSPVGAGLAGIWAGALVYLLTRRGGLPAVSHDRGVAIAGIASGVALAAAGLWLEWVCRIRPGDDGEREAQRSGRS